MLHKTVVRAVLLSGLLSLAGCGGGSAVSTAGGTVGPAPGSLAISASPSALTVPAGGSTSFVLNVAPASAVPVTVTLAGAPAGVSLTDTGSGPAGTGQQNESLSVAAAVAAGTYTLTLTAASNGQSASTTLTLLVNPALPAALAQIEQQTFEYFWNTTNPANGLAPDHYPGSPYASIAATGFALSA